MLMLSLKIQQVDDTNHHDTINLIIAVSSLPCHHRPIRQCLAQKNHTQNLIIFHHTSSCLKKLVSNFKNEYSIHSPPQPNVFGSL